MTTIERKATELAELISAHRVVRCDMQSEHATCIAREDLPEYGIKAGEQFELFTSSYEGYAYIIKSGVEGRECSCVGFEHRYTCKHVKASSQISAARYYARKGETGTLVLSPVATIREDDQAAHVEDDARTGKFPTRKDREKMPLSGNRGFSLLKPSGADAVVARVMGAPVAKRQYEDW